MHTGMLLDKMASALAAHWGAAPEPSPDWPLPLQAGADPFLASVALILGQGAEAATPAVLAALKALTSQGLSSPSALLQFPETGLFSLLGKCGKATAPLRRFCQLVGDTAAPSSGEPLGVLASMATEDLAASLSRVRGLGLETVESLLLHVFSRAVFPAGPGVYRIALRHGLVPEEVAREEVGAVFADWFYADIPRMQAMHHHMRLTAASFCKRASPACLHCPLEGMMPHVFL